MGVDFIKNKINQKSLDLAKRQQRQILYFTKSKIQDDVEREWTESFRNNKYSSDDYFQNFLRTVLLDDNFKTVLKYLRKPLASTTLINNEIFPSILKVLDAEDSRYDYYVDGNYISEPLDLKKESRIKTTLNSLFFRTNNLYVTDVKDGEPYTYELDIEDVVSLDHNNKRVTRIAFTTCIYDENNKKIEGIAYMDDDVSEFYVYKEDGEINETPIKSVERVKGLCPVDFIGTELYDNDFIVKKNPFSNLRGHLERYVILCTLQRINDINGTFPVTATIKSKGEVSRKIDTENILDMRELSKFDTSSVSNDSVYNVKPSPTQAGSNSEFQLEDLVNPETGEVNMTILQNLVNYFYIPVDILEHIATDKRELERYIVATSIGTFIENKQEGGMSDLHVGKTYDAMEDRLRSISQELSLVLNRVHYNELSVKHEKVETDIFCGSKFYMMSVEELYNVYNTCPNPIEKDNILVKISNTKNLQNPNKRLRDNILYAVIPYSDSEDFKTALEYKLVDEETMRLQVQFKHYITMFEAKYGSIIEFWKSYDGTDEQKTDYIKKELIKIIKDENKDGRMPISKVGSEGETSRLDTGREKS